jgi:hypothetical protein
MAGCVTRLSQSAVAHAKTLAHEGQRLAEDEADSVIGLMNAKRVE